MISPISLHCNLILLPVCCSTEGTPAISLVTVHCNLILLPACWSREGMAVQTSITVQCHLVSLSCVLIDTGYDYANINHHTPQSDSPSCLLIKQKVQMHERGFLFFLGAAASGGSTSGSPSGIHCSCLLLLHYQHCHLPMSANLQQKRVTLHISLKLNDICCIVPRCASARSFWLAEGLNLA